jgi:hypothetical protein
MDDRRLALRCGLATGAAILVLALAHGILGSANFLFWGGLENGPADAIRSLFSEVGGAIVHAAIVGACVGLSLRFVKPITPSSSFASVLARATIAALLAAAAYTVLRMIYAAITALTLRGPLFGDSFPGVLSSAGPVQLVGDGLLGGVHTFLYDLPVVLLVVLLVSRHWRDLRPSS